MKVLYIFSFVIFSISFSLPQENSHPSPKKEYINLHPGSNLPFSDAVKVGNTLYLSGQIGYDVETGKLVEGGIEAETKKALTNIKNLLESFGSSMDNIVKCTVVLADIKEWAVMNNVYKTFFKDYPARTSFAASGLALNARVEIECIAVINE
jgi:2-iminobutanoate/2-iminopropanoate deaminase